MINKKNFYNHNISLVQILLVFFGLFIIGYLFYVAAENDEAIRQKSSLNQNTGISCEEKIRMSCENTYPNKLYIDENRNYHSCVEAGKRLGSCSDRKIGIVETKIANNIDLPKHTVLDRINLLKGGSSIDILLEDISSITKDEFEEIAKTFYQNEKAQYNFYLTRDAMKANISFSFSEANPNALKEGSLGFIENNIVHFGRYFEL